MSMELRHTTWSQSHATRDAELDRLAYLRQPPATNPEYLTRPTQVRRIGRGFTVKGQPVEVGEIVTVEASVAAGLVQMGRAEYVARHEDHETL